MNLKPIVCAIVFLFAATSHGNADTLSDAGMTAPCASPQAAPELVRLLDGRKPTLACPVDFSPYTSHKADPEQEFSPVPTCAALLSLRRLATVVQ